MSSVLSHRQKSCRVSICIFTTKKQINKIHSSSFFTSGFRPNALYNTSLYYIYIFCDLMPIVYSVAFYYGLVAQFHKKNIIKEISQWPIHWGFIPGTSLDIFLFFNINLKMSPIIFDACPNSHAQRGLFW